MNHNKKRNVGIIYELLIRAVSAYLVEGNKIKAQSALDTLSKFYNRNTELYKEFRLFNALAKSTVNDTSIAAAILTESKSATRRFDATKLDKEKSALIKEINYVLADTDFYHRKVPDYKVYATIQNLLNVWREGDKSNLAEMVLIETKMIEWLTTEREVEIINEEIDKNVDSLVVKIMNEKFNDKYADKLTSSQKSLINEYVFSLQNDNGLSIKGKAIKIQSETLSEIAKIKLNETNSIILEKTAAVERKINEINFLTIDDDKLAKLMTLTQLVNELREK
jgi:hypothetical protein